MKSLRMISRGSRRGIFALMILSLRIDWFWAVAAAEEKTVSSPSTGMKFCRIPAGKFTIGSQQSDAELVRLFKEWHVHENRFSTQFPTRQIRISKPFLMGQFEVTQQEYLDVVGTNPSFHPRSGEKAKQHPVERVGWYDAVAFCNRLSEKDGLSPCYEIQIHQREGALINSASVKRIDGTGYRLPTEAEWEYACRAGTTSVWNTGNSIKSLNDAGWWGGFVNGDSPRGNGQLQPSAIGLLKPNKFGLYDMHGNVSEWCQDNASYTYRQWENGVSDPCFEQYVVKDRIYRGGSTHNSPLETTSAARHQGAMGEHGRGSTRGLRIVRNFAK